MSDSSSSLIIKKLPITNKSILVKMKTSYCISRVQTIGSPLTLNEVLIKIGQPVRPLNLLNKEWDFFP